MMRKEKPVLMWVSPEFKRIIKANAGFEGVQIIDYTKKLSEHLSINYDNKKQGKKNEYWFKF